MERTSDLADGQDLFEDTFVSNRRRFWSPLAPSVEILEHREATAWLGVALGFLTGAGFIRLADRLILTCTRVRPTLPQPKVRAPHGDDPPCWSRP